jgi:hypothetical protein
MKISSLKWIVTGIACLVLTSGFAQKKKQKQDIAAILSMCGCYEIQFNFAETFGEGKDYEYSKNYYSGGLEWAFPIVQEKDKVVIQHLLVINDTTIVKHWRQDWLYENRDLYVYDKDNTWKYQQLTTDDVKGQWTQKVYQVDDGPRYEAAATWVHADGRHFWESVADAPLPRRERTKRNDYNVMTRRNRHEITAYGWVHEQDNEKILRKATDQRLAREKGWNEYRKVADGKCAPAVTWWQENQTYWAVVRSVWDEIFETKQDLALNMKAEDQVLFMRLFALGKRLKGSKDQDMIKKKVQNAIQIHMREKTELAMN